MKIVVFSINPIFPRLITGGASKHLYQVARHLGEAGHQVEIVCAQPAGPLAPFAWSENVRVYPILPFHLPFPQPYAVSGDDLALIVQRVAARLAGTDRFYMHDGELLIPDLYAEIPTVVSFRDNIYPESVLGSFVGKFDDAICVSDYSASVIRHTAGRFYPALNERLHQVNNGIDFSVFKPVDASRLARRLGVDPQKGPILLHPHRPEPGKGLKETIQVVHQLVHRFGLNNLVVLVPAWIDSMVSDDEAAFHETMARWMQDLEVRSHFKFIPWLSPEEMPALYSLGTVTLCLGNLVEAFGNVAYESLACGAPSVVANVGVHRSLLPDHLIAKVDYGDRDAAVGKILDIVRGEAPVSDETIRYLKERLNFQRQVGAYARIITDCQKRPPLTFRWAAPETGQRYQLAPWCYIRGEQIYHDFKGGFFPAKQLSNLVGDVSCFSYDDIIARGISPATWQEWVDRTYIVPVETA